MRFADDFFQTRETQAQRAFAEMKDLEAGTIVNQDEQRMVGHYWLRAPQSAPSADLRQEVEQTNASIRVRSVDVQSTRYAIARRYMLRLRKEDFDDPHDVAKLAAIAHCSIAEFRERFSYVTADEPPAVITEMASNVR